MRIIISHSWGTEHRTGLMTVDVRFNYSLPCLDHGKHRKSRIRWPGVARWAHLLLATIHTTSSHHILQALAWFLLCPCLPSLPSQHPHHSRMIHLHQSLRARFSLLPLSLPTKPSICLPFTMPAKSGSWQWLRSTTNADVGTIWCCVQFQA